MNKLRYQRSTLISPDHAHKLFSPHFDDITKCIEHGWAQWQEFGSIAPQLRVALNNRARAGFVWCHIVEEAKRTFTGVRGIKIVEENGLTFFSFEGKAHLRFKKLNQGFRPSNHDSQQQNNILWQQPLDGIEMPHATYVDVGYRLDRAGVAIRDVRMVCWRGQYKHFSFHLVESRDEQAQPRLIAEPTTAPARVRAKGVARKGRANNA